MRYFKNAPHPKHIDGMKSNTPLPCFVLLSADTNIDMHYYMININVLQKRANFSRPGAKGYVTSCKINIAFHAHVTNIQKNHPLYVYL